MKENNNNNLAQKLRERTNQFKRDFDALQKLYNQFYKQFVEIADKQKLASVKKSLKE